MDNLNKFIDQLPQKYPFLMLDKVLEFEEGKRVVALKNVSINEYFFKGHFPGSPVMPGVLIIEAMAQAGILLFSEGDETAKGATYYLGSVKAKFLNPVHPGDVLKIEVAPIKIVENMGLVEAKATVDGKVVAKAELGFSKK